MNRLIAVLFIAISIQVSGQNDVIRLRNGSLIRGDIVKNSVDDMLVIRIDSTDITLKYDQIIAIRSQGFKYRTNYPVNDRGYFNYSSLGLIFQRSNSDDPVIVEPTIHTINGYTFSQYLKVGIGIGYDVYPDINTVPIYMNVQGDAMTTKVSPLYSFGIGYGIAAAGDGGSGQIRSADGGLFLQPSVGLAFHGIRNSFVIAIDYKHQVTQLEYNDWWWGGELTETRTFRNMALKLGFVF